jgi:hypothetical protein
MGFDADFERLYPSEAKAPSGSNVVRGASTAFAQLKPLAQGTVGLIGATMEKAFGEGGISTAVKNYGLHGYEQGMQKIAATARDTDELTTAWQKAKEGNLGALMDWGSYALGYGAAQIGMAAVTGGVGSAGAQALAKGLGKEYITKAVGTKAAEIAAAQQVELQAGKIGAAQVLSGEALTAQATKQVAAKIAATGQVGALAASGTGQELGGIYGEAAEGGKQLSGADLARSWGAGVAAGAVETFANKLGLDALAGKIKIPGAGRAGRATVGGVAGGTLEGGTEVVQTGLERFGAGKALTGDEAVKDYINSGAMGALPGGAAGMIRGAITPSPARTVTPEQEALNKLSSSATVGDAIQAANELATGTVVGDLHSAIDAFQATPGATAPAAPAGSTPVTPSAAGSGLISQQQYLDKLYPGQPQPDLAAQQQAVQEIINERYPAKPTEEQAQADFAAKQQQVQNKVNELYPAKPQADIAAQQQQVQTKADSLYAETPAQQGVVVPANQPAGAGVAAARVQADSGRTLPTRAFKETGPDYVDLQPMDPMQAQQRLAVLREQEPGTLAAVAHPTVQNRFAIVRQPVAEKVSPAISATEQRSLTESSLAGKDANRRAEDAPRQVIVTRAMKSIEERGGVASPAEARIVQEAGLGKPYDRIDESLSREPTVNERLTAATGIELGNRPKESKTFPAPAELAQRQAAESAEAANTEQKAAAQAEADRIAENEAAGRASFDKLAAERKPDAPLSSPILQAPSVDSVIAALRVAPALRTAEQRRAVERSKKTYSPENQALLERAAGPQLLGAADKARLRDLRSERGPVQSSVQPELKSTPRGTPLAVLQKLLECIG